MSRRITRQRTARDNGSSAVEFSLMVAAMAAMILAVVLGVGRVVGDVLFHGCTEMSSQLRSGGGACVHPDPPAAGDEGQGGKTAGPGAQGADDVGPNDLGISDDM